MANTKKTTSTTEEKVVKVNNTADIKSLEKQVQEQQEQIKQLMEMLRNNVAIPVTTESNDVGADEEILVISLTPNKLNLVGSDGSVLFAFDNMYEEQYIDYASLKEIVRANRDMAKSGRFYILDERVVNKLRLKNNYKNILTPEQLKKLFAVSADKAIDLYNLANDMQRQTIIELVKQAKFNSKNVDYNLLQKLSELSGIDLMNVEDATQIDVTK